LRRNHDNQQEHLTLDEVGRCDDCEVAKNTSAVSTTDARYWRLALMHGSMQVTEQLWQVSLQKHTTPASSQTAGQHKAA